MLRKANDEQLHELLYQALETELGGVKIYETAISCAINSDLKSEWKEYLAQTRHHVEVEKHLGALPALPLDRHRVLQILVNLISNAKHAMAGMPVPGPRIQIGAALVEGTGLRLTVSDNGEGIAAENLTRIFSHGFTTRKEGHGFGLHSCVLAAQEMGGRLTVHSDGPGQGSTFTLDIPVDPVETPR